MAALSMSKTEYMDVPEDEDDDLPSDTDADELLPIDREDDVEDEDDDLD